jgi:8-oxo-dGTP pyrophosphatase MutT (NUDIX family)
MNKNTITAAIEAYQPFDATDAAHKAQTLDFLARTDAFWQRTTLEGHLTGSAWVRSPDGQRVLLIHHAKLDRWFQPGGHAEPTDTDLLATAHREALEECGLKAVTLAIPHIFDIDVHPIPAKGDVPEHLHYDIRYCFTTDDETSIFDQNEIKGMRWVERTSLLGTDTSASIRRMAEKSV